MQTGLGLRHMYPCLRILRVRVDGYTEISAQMWEPLRLLQELQELTIEGEFDDDGTSGDSEGEFDNDDDDERDRHNLDLRVLASLPRLRLLDIQLRSEDYVTWLLPDWALCSQLRDLRICERFPSAVGSLPPLTDLSSVASHDTVGSGWCGADLIELSQEASDDLRASLRTLQVTGAPMIESYEEWVDDCKFTDNSIMAVLVAFPNLTALDLSFLRFSGDVLAALPRTLKTLCLDGMDATAFTADALKRDLLSLPNLTQLALSFPEDRLPDDLEGPYPRLDLSFLAVLALTDIRVEESPVTHPQLEWEDDSRSDDDY